MSNLYNASAMTEEEVCERFYDNMKGKKLIGMTRALANDHMQYIMFSSKCYLAERTPRSMIHTFKKRMASFIIR